MGSSPKKKGVILGGTGRREEIIFNKKNIEPRNIQQRENYVISCAIQPYKRRSQCDEPLRLLLEFAIYLFFYALPQAKLY
jgi:hypothetical protein